MRHVLVALLFIFTCAGSAHADDTASQPPCAGDPAFATLDFWLGDWDVFVGDQLAGSNHIAKILDGCAITEDWTGAAGGKGHSLFYYVPAEETWKQVWVTGNVPARGGVKEKTLVEKFPDGGVRFQGEVKMAGGGSYLDRTTLTPLENGDVRQLIEVSTDGGGVWLAVFDAKYVRHK